MLSLFSSSLGALLRQARPGARPDDAQPDAGAAERDWRGAYQRLQAQALEPAEPQAPDTPLPLQPAAARSEAPAPAPDLPPAAALPPTPTVQRVEALLAQAPMAPQRVWQVELPSAGAGWQLRVEQAQPQAPLLLELRVPAVLQPQARRQLADLDKRLRDTGHDVLASRLQPAVAGRLRRVDEVQP